MPSNEDNVRVKIDNGTDHEIEVSWYQGGGSQPMIDIQPGQTRWANVARNGKPHIRIALVKVK